MSAEAIEDIKLDEKIKRVPTLPSKYNVILINDDATPMEFVIGILQTIYKHSETTAKDITIKIHNDGSAVVGTYKYEVAEQKATETIQVSRNNGFPLSARIEKE